MKSASCNPWTRWSAWINGQNVTRCGIYIVSLSVFVGVINWHLYQHVYGTDVKFSYTSKPDLLTLVTYLPRNPENLQKMVRNTLPNWHHLGPRVHRIVYVPQDVQNVDSEVMNAMRKYNWNVVKMPGNFMSKEILASTITYAQARVKTSFYCFAEWDILFDAGLIGTLDKMQEIRFQFENIIAIGNAHNVKGTQENIENVLYLIVSAYFPWNSMPKEKYAKKWPLEVVARQASLYMPNTAVVDISQTALTVRQALNITYRATEWKRFGMSPFSPLGKSSFDNACVTCANYMTSSGGRGKVRVMEKVKET